MGQKNATTYFLPVCHLIVTLHKGYRLFLPFCLLLFPVLLWYDKLCMIRGRRREFPPRKIYFKGAASGNGVFPCLFRIKRKAVSKLYREKIDQLQAAEQRLLEQKAEAQRAARALAEQARRDGDGLVREAQNAVKVLENEAMQRAGEAGQAADAALRSDAERTCTAIRQQAEQRMDTAVRAIVEKVVKR